MTTGASGHATAAQAPAGADAGTCNGAEPLQDAPADHLVYLHGFRSSSRSVKAVKVLDWMTHAGAQLRLWQPDLAVSPAAAMQQVSQQCLLWRAENPSCTIDFMGSSLGGFYATVLAERFGGRAVLLNPAVAPWVDLKHETGRRKVYFSDKEIEFLPAYLDELEAMNVATLTHPQRYFLLACMGDEVLDANTMIARYHQSPSLIVPGGDHAISDFDQYLPVVMQFVRWGQA